MFFLYISTYAHAGPASSSLRFPVITNTYLPHEGSSLSCLADLLTCSFPFFTEMYESLFLLYAGLVRLGHAAYTVQDNYNASNWADSFDFFTVESVSLEVVT